MTTIRPIEAKDEARWRELWQAYNAFYEREIPEATTAATFARLLDPGVPLYGAVAEDAGQVIGFVTWLPHLSTSSTQDAVYLHDLYVDPAVRNKGTGRQLIEHVYAASEAAGAGRVYWHTQHFNHRAQLLYTKVAAKSDFVQYVHPLPAKKQ